MEFLKVLWDNLCKGPVTDPFPLGETFTPERFRGKVTIDPALCVGCGTCRHVCAAGAININKMENGTGFEITVWHNSCCLCGQCRHYCPTKAITLTNDWHNAHRNSEKYTRIVRASVPYDHCAACGANVRFLPPDVLKRIYADHPEINVDVISRLCPSCRQIDLAVEEDNACHINHIDNMVGRSEACHISDKKPEAVASEVAPEAVALEVALVTPETAFVPSEVAAPEALLETASEATPVEEAEIPVTPERTMASEDELVRLSLAADEYVLTEDAPSVAPESVSVAELRQPAPAPAHLKSSSKFAKSTAKSSKAKVRTSTESKETQPKTAAKKSKASAKPKKI